MGVTDLEKEQITKILKKSNRYAWKDSIIEKAIKNIEKVRDGTIKLNDYLVPGVLSWEDYFYNTNLIQFVNGTYRTTNTL